MSYYIEHAEPYYSRHKRETNIFDNIGTGKDEEITEKTPQFSRQKRYFVDHTESMLDVTSNIQETDENELNSGIENKLISEILVSDEPIIEIATTTSYPNPSKEKIEITAELLTSKKIKEEMVKVMNISPIQYGGTPKTTLSVHKDLFSVTKVDSEKNRRKTRDITPDSTQESTEKIDTLTANEKSSSEQYPESLEITDKPEQFQNQKYFIETVENEHTTVKAAESLAQVTNNKNVPLTTELPNKIGIFDHDNQVHQWRKMSELIKKKGRPQKLFMTTVMKINETDSEGDKAENILNSYKLNNEKDTKPSGTVSSKNKTEKSKPAIINRGPQMESPSHNKDEQADPIKEMESEDGPMHFWIDESFLKGGSFNSYPIRVAPIESTTVSSNYSFLDKGQKPTIKPMTGDKGLTTTNKSNSVIGKDDHSIEVLTHKPLELKPLPAKNINDPKPKKPVNITVSQKSKGNFFEPPVKFIPWKKSYFENWGEISKKNTKFSEPSYFDHALVKKPLEILSLTPRLKSYYVDSVNKTNASLKIPLPKPHITSSTKKPEKASTPMPKSYNVTTTKKPQKESLFTTTRTFYYGSSTKKPEKGSTQKLKFYYVTTTKKPKNESLLTTTRKSYYVTSTKIPEKGSGLKLKSNYTSSTKYNEKGSTPMPVPHIASLKKQPLKGRTPKRKSYYGSSTRITKKESIFTPTRKLYYARSAEKLEQATKLTTMPKSFLSPPVKKPKKGTIAMPLPKLYSNSAIKPKKAAKFWPLPKFDFNKPVIKPKYQIRSIYKQKLQRPPQAKSEKTMKSSKTNPSSKLLAKTRKHNRKSNALRGIVPPINFEDEEFTTAITASKSTITTTDYSVIGIYPRMDYMLGSLPNNVEKNKIIKQDYTETSTYDIEKIETTTNYFDSLESIKSDLEKIESSLESDRVQTTTDSVDINMNNNGTSKDDFDKIESLINYFESLESAKSDFDYQTSTTKKLKDIDKIKRPNKYINKSVTTSNNLDNFETPWDEKVEDDEFTTATRASNSTITTTDNSVIGIYPRMDYTLGSHTNNVEKPELIKKDNIETSTYDIEKIETSTNYFDTVETATKVLDKINTKTSDTKIIGKSMYDLEKLAASMDSETFQATSRNDVKGATVKSFDIDKTTIHADRVATKLKYLDVPDTPINKINFEVITHKVGMDKERRGNVVKNKTKKVETTKNNNKKVDKATKNLKIVKTKNNTRPKTSNTKMVDKTNKRDSRDDTQDNTTNILQNAMNALNLKITIDNKSKNHTTTKTTLSTTTKAASTENYFNKFQSTKNEVQNATERTQPYSMEELNLLIDSHEDNDIDTTTKSSESSTTISIDDRLNETAFRGRHIRDKDKPGSNESTTQRPETNTQSRTTTTTRQVTYYAVKNKPSSTTSRTTTLKAKSDGKPAKNILREPVAPKILTKHIIKVQDEDDEDEDDNVSGVILELDPSTTSSSTPVPTTTTEQTLLGNDTDDDLTPIDTEKEIPDDDDDRDSGAPPGYRRVHTIIDDVGDPDEDLPARRTTWRVRYLVTPQPLFPKPPATKPPNITVVNVTEPSSDYYEDYEVNMDVNVTGKNLTQREQHLRAKYLRTKLELEMKAREETLRVEELERKRMNEIRQMYDYRRVGDDFIENQFIHVSLSRKTGKTLKVTLKNNVTMDLDIQFHYYDSDDPRKLDRPTQRQPGAFVFRPLDPLPNTVKDRMQTKVFKNNVVQEVHTRFSDYASYVLRLYNNSVYLELDWLVGPVPIHDDLGKEIFIRYTTDLENQGVFYTDANGRQTIKRIRDKRSTFVPIKHDHVAGNIYPVTSKISIEDLNKNIRFSIFNDRAQGGTSLKDGEIDLFLHRRILTDDSGIHAVLNETTSEGLGLIVRGKHYLYVTKQKQKSNRVFEKKFQKELQLPPQFFASAPNPYNVNFKSAWFIWLGQNNEFSALNNKLPPGIHLLSLESIGKDQILIRLENFLEKSDVKRDGSKTVILNDLFKHVKLKDIKETTLAANQWLENWVPLQWRKDKSFYKNFNEAYGNNTNYSTLVDGPENLKPIEALTIDTEIVLKPQEIRTFICTYSYVPTKTTV